MIDEELIKEVVNKVLSTLKTNSLTIEQLTSVDEPPDDAYIEISGGHKISYGNLKKVFESYLPGIDLVSSYGDRVDAAICQAFFSKEMRENRHVFLSENEYEKLKESGKLDPDLIYMTYEDE